MREKDGYFRLYLWVRETHGRNQGRRHSDRSTEAHNPTTDGREQIALEEVTD